MADREIVKRTSRVTFLGVSNLPRDKALGLRDVLQKIVDHLTDLHQSVDDQKMSVDEKFKKLKDVSVLESDVQKLTSLTKDQVDICVGQNEIKSQVEQHHHNIADNQRKLADALHRYLKASDNKSRNSIAQAIVEDILHIVESTIFLLRDADRFTIHSFDTIAAATEDAARATQSAKTMEELMEGAQRLSLVSVQLVKAIGQRAEALEDKNAAKKLSDSASTVQNQTVPLISSARDAVQGAPRSEAALHPILSAIKVIRDTLRVSPEFSVNFEVSYIDDELKLKLANLAAAVRAADHVNVAGGCKAINNEVERLAKQADPTAAKKARDASSELAAQAKATLGVRVKNEVASPEFAKADTQLHASMNKLHEAYSALPVATTAKTTTLSLLQVAQQLSKKFDILLAS